MTLIKKTTASIALAAIASGLLVTGTNAYSTSEVEAANKLAAAGIVNSHTNAADYQLDRQVLRQEIAALARGVAKLEKTTTCSNIFADVTATTPNTWACYSVEALANAGLIARNANFRPESNITKAEAVGMIVKAAYGNEYQAVAGSDWQKQVVDFAVSKGIVSQFTNYTTPATRGFVFEVAAKALDTKKSGNDLTGLIDSILNGGDKTTTEPTTDNKENNIVRADSNLVVTLSPESPSNGMVPANTSRAVMLAFDVTAGKTDVTLKKASLKFTGLGDSKIISDLAIYSNDVKLTKNSGTGFNSTKLTADLTFDRDIVVKAGETKTLYVTATINPGTDTYNQTVRVNLTNVEASSTVTGAELTGATLTPYKVSNIGKAEAASTGTSGNLYLGQEGVIYNFSVKETNKKEDLVVKAVTFKEGTGNGVDLDNLTNLALYVNNQKIDATFTYQKSSIVASLNQEVKSNQKVNFVLKGEVIDDLNEKLVLKLDDVYAIGRNTGVAVQVTNTAAEIARTIQGTSVNFAFNKVGNGEVSVDVTDAKVGELVFVTTTDYTAKVKVTVTGTTGTTAAPTYTNIELGGDTPTRDSAANVYTFTDISLAKGTTKLPLTIDTEENASGTLTFKVEVIELEEDSLGDKVTVSKVLNNTQLSRTVTVKDTDIRLTSTSVNTTKVVAKDNQTVVLYKGRFDLSGNEPVTLEDLTFTGTVTPTASSTTNPLTTSLEDYISGVTLNIGGKTFNGTVDGNTVSFDSVYAQIAANSKDVAMLVTATVKDRELEVGQSVNMKLATSKISYSTDKKSVSNKTVTTSLSTQVNIVAKEQLVVNPVAITSNNVMLAGTNSVTLASFKIDSTSSTINVDNLTINAVLRDYNDGVVSNRYLGSAITNIRLMDGSNVLASGGYVEENSNTVKFDSFDLPQSGSTRTLSLVADLSTYSTSGGENDTFLGKISFQNLVITSDDLPTVTYLTNETSKISIVPARVLYTVVEKFGVNNAEATVRVTVDAGNNSISRLDLSELVLSGSHTFSKVTVDGENVSTTLNAINKEITGLTQFDVKLLLSGTTSNGAVVLEKLVLTATWDNHNVAFRDSNKDTVNLGGYSTSN